MVISLSRDIVGAHPLYYYHRGNTFLYANRLSDLVKQPGFLKELDLNSLALYFHFGFFPEPYSVYKNTYKLKAGHRLEYNSENNRLVMEKYWDISDVYAQPKHRLNEIDAIERTEALMTQVYRNSYASSANPGVLLSGGYDSSSVAALLQTQTSENIKTFCVGFNEPAFNEAHHAKRISEYLGTEHYEYYCTQADALSLIPKLADILDEPIGDASIIPTSLACLLAAKYVDSVLSADGLDELLGGYDKYLTIKRKRALFGSIPSIAAKPACYFMRSKLAINLANILGISNAQERLERFSYMLGASDGQILKIDCMTFTPKEVDELLVNKPSELTTNFDAYSSRNIVEASMEMDFKTVAQDLVLFKVNSAATYANIKNLEPVLEQGLIEHLVRLDLGLKINHGNGKYILKQIVHKYIPKELMDRPKKGFNVPIVDWFQSHLKVYLLDYLNEDVLRKQGILNPGYVAKLRDDYLRGNKSNVTKLWYLLVFQLWLESSGAYISS